jgi:hypothetical protein
VSLALRAAFVAEPKQKLEFKIIRTLFPQYSAAPNATTENIIECTISDVGNEQRPHYYDVACSVLEVARRTVSEHQDELCGLVLALKQRLVNYPKTGELSRMDEATKV